jgi:hypothetical protein
MGGRCVALGAPWWISRASWFSQGLVGRARRGHTRRTATVAVVGRADPHLPRQRVSGRRTSPDRKSAVSVRQPGHRDGGGPDTACTLPVSSGNHRRRARAGHMIPCSDFLRRRVPPRLLPATPAPPRRAVAEVVLSRLAPHAPPARPESLGVGRQQAAHSATLQRHSNLSATSSLMTEPVTPNTVPCLGPEGKDVTEQISSETSKSLVMSARSPHCSPHCLSHHRWALRLAHPRGRGQPSPTTPGQGPCSAEPVRWTHGVSAKQ